MSDLADFINMVSPCVYVRCLVELLEDGVITSTPYDVIASVSGYGETSPFSFLDHWSVYENGFTGTTRVTLTHLADILPMRWNWDYIEIDDTPGADIPGNAFIELITATATKTFSPSGSTMHSYGPTHISNIVFTAPT